jgi:hypothetical protein
MSTGEPLPVFVHSWWRTASTYVRDKLRRRDDLCCYGEPLHEVIGHLTLKIVRAPVDPAVLKRLHHPALHRTYFADYEPLLAEGTGFHKSLSYDRYFLAPAETDTQLEQYLARLIDSARNRNKRAVLAFCRSSLRAAWMKQRFGGLHLALLRNPREQWGSMLEQHRQGGTYFLAGMLAIAGKLRSRFPRAFAHLPCELPDYRERLYNPDELGKYIELAKRMRAYDLYAVFALIWLASALQVLSVADVVLDSDSLSSDGTARQRAAALLATKDLDIDFSDCATPAHRDLPLSLEALDSVEMAAVRALSRNARALVVYHPSRVAANAEVLAPLSGQLVRIALSALRPAQGKTATAVHSRSKA